MIMFKAKSKFNSKGDRWYKHLKKLTTIDELDWEDYNFIIGENIYTEITDKAKEEFEYCLMMHTLMT